MGKTSLYTVSKNACSSLCIEKPTRAREVTPVPTNNRVEAAEPFGYCEAMRTIQRALQKFNLHVPVQFDASLSEYTTFRVGGPAEALVQPRTTGELTQLLAALAHTTIPLTILGGGANVVVSDNGIPGVVVHTALT
jgi:hypothetical protein